MAWSDPEGGDPALININVMAWSDPKGGKGSTRKEDGREEGGRGHSYPVKAHLASSVLVASFVVWA